MQTLHVHNVPESLIHRLKQLARAHNRSLSAQVISMLTQALEIEDQRQLQIQALASIQSRCFPLPPGTPDSLELLRGDRPGD